MISQCANESFQPDVTDDSLVMMMMIDLLALVGKQISEYSLPQIQRGRLHGVMVKAMDCGIVVCEFVLQSRYYIHFRANTLGKGMNPIILPAMS